MKIKINDKGAFLVGLVLFYFGIYLYRRIENIYYLFTCMPICIGASLLFRNIDLEDENEQNRNLGKR